MALSQSKSRSNQKYRDKFEYITTRISAEEKIYLHTCGENGGVH